MDRDASYAGYTLAARLPAASAAVERWRARGPDGVAEVFIGPQALARRARSLPAWGPFPRIVTGSERGRWFVVVPGTIELDLEALAARLPGGACVAFAWHLTAALAEVHEHGGAHGALHPSWCGLDPRGHLVVRPALAAAVKSEPDPDASAQATDCLQLVTLLDTLAIERADEPAIELLLAGLARDRARLRMQPGRAARQTLAALLKRHPLWEERLVEDLGASWAIGALPRAPMAARAAPPAHPWNTAAVAAITPQSAPIRPGTAPATINLGAAGAGRSVGGVGDRSARPAAQIAPAQASPAAIQVAAVAPVAAVVPAAAVAAPRADPETADGAEVSGIQVRLGRPSIQAAARVAAAVPQADAPPAALPGPAVPAIASVAAALAVSGAEDAPPAEGPDPDSAPPEATGADPSTDASEEAGEGASNVAPAAAHSGDGDPASIADEQRESDGQRGDGDDAIDDSADAEAGALGDSALDDSADAEAGAIDDSADAEAHALGDSALDDSAGALDDDDAAPEAPDDSAIDDSADAEADALDDSADAEAGALDDDDAPADAEAGALDDDDASADAEADAIDDDDDAPEAPDDAPPAIESDGEEFDDERSVGVASVVLPPTQVAVTEEDLLVALAESTDGAPTEPAEDQEADEEVTHGATADELEDDVEPGDGEGALEHAEEELEDDEGSLEHDDELGPEGDDALLHDEGEVGDDDELGGDEDQDDADRVLAIPTSPDAPADPGDAEPPGPAVSAGEWDDDENTQVTANPLVEPAAPLTPEVAGGEDPADAASDPPTTPEDGGFVADPSGVGGLHVPGLGAAVAADPSALFTTPSIAPEADPAWAPSPAFAPEAADDLPVAAAEDAEARSDRLARTSPRPSSTPPVPHSSPEPAAARVAIGGADDDSPRWASAGGVTGDENRERELGSGKWAEEAEMGLDDVRRQMDDKPVRDVDFEPAGANWTALIAAGVLIALLVGWGIWAATRGSSTDAPTAEAPAMPRTVTVRADGGDATITFDGRDLGPAPAQVPIPPDAKPHQLCAQPAQGEPVCQEVTAAKMVANPSITLSLD